jgi:hypothetical protein
MDYSSYELPFLSGPRRVHAFSYVLAYSRRQYVRFVERQDMATTQAEHVNAFQHFGGVARTCLYDNAKLVVLRWEDGQPVYNRRFLAFATHYGYRPWACVPYRSQTKGKVERPFLYIERNLLNGRTFSDIDDLNRVTSGWLQDVADQRIHRETRERPIERFERERELLLPLPERDYDTADVVYRVVDAEGLIAYQTNRYSVPWQRIGQLLAARVTQQAVLVYGPDLTELARHERLVDGAHHKSVRPEHRPDDSHRYHEGLRERFHELGPAGERFMAGLVMNRRYSWKEAARTLSLLGLYSQADLVRALERAVRYCAFSCRAIERILAAQATPRVSTGFDDELRDQLDRLRIGPEVAPRPGSDYDALFEEQDDEPHGEA